MDFPKYGVCSLGVIGEIERLELMTYKGNKPEWYFVGKRAFPTEYTEANSWMSRMSSVRLLSPRECIALDELKEKAWMYEDLTK